MATTQSIKEELLSRSTKIDDQSDGPFVHKLPMDEVFCDKKLKFRKMELRSPATESPVEHRKMFLIIGESGSGKTTLVNSMINYMLGVTFEDNFRFEINRDDEDATNSQLGRPNKWITSYTVDLHERFYQPIGLTIVDTPGFGDMNIWKFVERISQFFSPSEGLSKVDAIGLVLPANTTKLTCHIQSILSRFDNDARNNVFLIVTFADVNDPGILLSLEESKISYKMLLKFNNSAIFAKYQSLSNSTTQKLNKLLWDMSMNSLKVTFQNILQIKPKPLLKIPTRGGSSMPDLDQESTKLGFKLESRAKDDTRNTDERETTDKNERAASETAAEEVAERTAYDKANSERQTTVVEEETCMVPERAAREREEAERRAAEKKVLKERAEAERKAEQEKADEKRAKAERKATEKKAKAEKKALEEKKIQEAISALLKAAKSAEETAEREKAAREKAETEIRIVAERAAKEREEAEIRAAEERISKERAEAERKAEQEKADEKKAAIERKAAEKKAKAEKKALDEIAFQEAISAVLKAAKSAEETAEREKTARERAEEEIRLMAERTAKERAEAERKATEERVTNEGAEDEIRVAQEKANEKKAKKERKAAEKKALEEKFDAALKDVARMAEKAARYKAEADKLAAEKAKAEEERQALEKKAAKKAEKAFKEKQMNEFHQGLLRLVDSANEANERAEKERTASENADRKKQAMEEKTANEKLQKELKERQAAELKAAKKRAEVEKRARKEKIMADLKQNSVLSSQPGSPNIYELKMKETFSDPKILVRKLELGRADVREIDEKVIMVVGEAGSGKTTLINSMVNYMLGVDYEDQYRFKIIADVNERSLQNSLSQSQTQWVTSYTFHHREGNRQPFTLTLVDTPGFGDTGGIINDKKIVDRIREFFSSPAGIDHLDAVGFVVPSSAARLTQRYVFDSVLALFGKDIGENIYMLITHADANIPPVLESLKEAKINYRTYIKLNNSAFFPKTSCNEMDDDTLSFYRTFWELGIKSFSTFFQDLIKMKPKSLTLTKDVLRERQILQTHLIGIKAEIDKGLCKLNQLESELGVIKSHRSDLDRNKNFEYTVAEDTVVHEDIPAGTYITNCLSCNTTCHYPCQIPDDDDKANCAAMTDGKCHVCKSGCVWSVHKNMRYKFVIKQQKVKKTANDLLNRYRDTEGKLVDAKQLAQNVYEEYLATRVKIMDMVTECKNCLLRLQEIALKPDPLSEVDYIDKLIEAEQSNKFEGYAERIKQLNEVRELAVCAGNLQKDELVHKLMENEKRVQSKFPEFNFQPSATALIKALIKVSQWT